MERVGVILLHRGEPRDAKEVRPFLKALYSDPAVLSAPMWQGFFAGMRARSETADLERALKEIGNKSPLWSSIDVLASRLDQKLNGSNAQTAAAGYKVAWASRYAQPTVADALAGLRKDEIHHFIAIGLYPYESALSAESLQKAAEGDRVSVVSRFGEHEAFLALQKAQLAEALAGFRSKDDVTLIFVAPAGQAEGEHPPLLKRLTENLPNTAWFTSWDQKFDAMVKNAGAQKRSVLAVPFGYVVDQIESVHALDVRGRKIAKESGVAEYQRVPAMADSQEFADVLKTVLEAHRARLSALGI